MHLPEDSYGSRMLLPTLGSAEQKQRTLLFCHELLEVMQEQGDALIPL